MQSFTTNEVTLTCLRHSSFSLYCILHSCWFVVGFLASSPGKTLALGLAEAEMENKIIDYKSIFRWDKARMYAVVTISSSVGSRAIATFNVNVLIQSKVNKDKNLASWLWQLLCSCSHFLQPATKPELMMKMMVMMMLLNMETILRMTTMYHVPYYPPPPCQGKKVNMTPFSFKPPSAPPPYQSSLKNLIRY